MVLPPAPSHKRRETAAGALRPGTGRAAPRNTARPRSSLEGRGRGAVSTRRAPEGTRTPNLLIRSCESRNAVLTCEFAVWVRADGGELDAVPALPDWSPPDGLSLPERHQPAQAADRSVG